MPLPTNTPARVDAHARARTHAVLRHLFFLATFIGSTAIGWPQLVRLLVGPTPSPLLTPPERGNKELSLGARVQQLLQLAALIVLGTWWMTEGAAGMERGQCRCARAGGGVLGGAGGARGVRGAPVQRGSLGTLHARPCG